MTDAEEQLLKALAHMCDQYLSSSSGDELDHQFMSAGERAIALLVQHRLVEPIPRGGKWTTAGQDLLRA